MEQNRIHSIDIMRGLTLALMLFVNDLFVPNVPEWLGHTRADVDGMGLADWVFPGFLFMVGMAIPFSIGNRIARGEDNFRISRHIFIRTISLLIIGVLMLNTGRVDPELTGMSRNLWAILMYTGVFITWNSYRETETNFTTITGLRLIGMALLTYLVFRFKSGEPENDGSLILGWWGILGLIGWGYLVSAFIYLFVRDKILYTALASAFFLLLNILDGLKLLSFLDPVKPLFGVIIGGNVPFIVITGLLTTLILKRLSKEGSAKTLSAILIFGVISIVAGFVLRKWFIISKIYATPSWGLICNGISMILFCILFWIMDVRKKTAWADFIKPAGQNSLTTYLAPDIVYHLIWAAGIPVLAYKSPDLPQLVVVAGSIVWALAMIALTAALVRIGIKLRL